MAARRWSDLLAEQVAQEVAAFQSRLLDTVRQGISRLDAESTSPASSASLVDLARRLAHVRKLRHNHFSAELFHERAWDMLLELFIQHSTGRDVWVKSLLSATDGSPTTAIRWLDHLETTGLIARQADEEDRRRVRIRLTIKGEEAMVSYLQDIQSLT